MISLYRYILLLWLILVLLLILLGLIIGSLIGPSTDCIASALGGPRALCELVAMWEQKRKRVDTMQDGEELELDLPCACRANGSTSCHLGRGALRRSFRGASSRATEGSVLLCLCLLLDHNALVGLV